MSRTARRAGVLLAGVVVIVAVADLPTTTQQGVNYVVSAHSLPLYAKALDFVDRDSNYRRLSAAVMAGAAGDEAKMRAAFDWTTANIRATPLGFPVIDDHTWHIIVRGYGQAVNVPASARASSSSGGIPRTTSSARANALVLKPVSCARSKQCTTRSRAATGVMRSSVDGLSQTRTCCVRAATGDPDDPDPGDQQ